MNWKREFGFDEDEEDKALLPFGARRRVGNIRPGEVSLVDRAANRRTFLAIKREGENGMASASELYEDAEGNLWTVARKSEDAEVATGKMGHEVKEGVTRLLTEVVERVTSILQAVKEAQEGPGGALPPWITQAVRAVAGVLRSIPERYPYPSPLSKALEAVEEALVFKQQEPVPAPIKAGVVRILTEVTERLASVLNAVKAAPEGGEGFPEALGRSIQSVAGALGSVLERYPSPMAKEEKVEQSKQIQEALAHVLKDMVGGDKSATAAALKDIHGVLTELAKAEKDEARTARFSEALAKIEKLLKQFGDTDNLLEKPTETAFVATEVVQARQEKSLGATPPANVGAGRQPDASVVGTAKDVVDPKTDKALDARFEEMIKGQRRSDEQIAALVGVVKKLAERVDGAESVVQSSGLATVAKSERTWEDLDGDYPWASDLNTKTKARF